MNQTFIDVEFSQKKEAKRYEIDSSERDLRILYSISISVSTAMIVLIRSMRRR